MLAVMFTANIAIDSSYSGLFDCKNSTKQELPTAATPSTTTPFAHNDVDFLQAMNSRSLEDGRSFARRQVFYHTADHWIKFLKLFCVNLKYRRLVYLLLIITYQNHDWNNEKKKRRKPE